MSAHTPGPWVIGAYGRVMTPDGETLRTCGVATPGADSDEYRANTRLIAAAPDMLETLEAIEFALSQGMPAAMVLDENSPIRDCLRAAIAKAVEGAQS